MHFVFLFLVAGLEIEFLLLIFLLRKMFFLSCCCAMAHFPSIERSSYGVMRSGSPRVAWIGLQHTSFGFEVVHASRDVIN